MKTTFCRVICLMLAVLLLILSGCGSGREHAYSAPDEPAKETAKPSQTQEETAGTPETAAKPAPEFEGDLGELLKKNVRLTEEEAAELIALTLSIRVEYTDAELLPIEEQMSRYEALPEYVPAAENLFANGPLTGDQIYEITTANIASTTVNQKHIMPEEDRRLLCPYIAEALNTYYETYAPDPIRLSEKISALTLVDYHSIQEASYSPADDVLEVKMDGVRNNPENLRKLAFHECAHLVQAEPGSGARMQNVEFRFGPGCKFPDVEMNAIEWNWLTEGGAEMLSRRFCGTAESMNYKSFCKAIQAIDMAMLPRTDGKTALLETMSLAPDMEAVFDYFGCRNEEDAAEILTFMAMMDVALQGKPSEEFKKLYQEQHPDSTLRDDERRVIYALDLGETIAKLFYRNLAERLADREMTLEQVFAFMAGAESGLSAMTFFADSRTEDVSETFLTAYVTMQTALFELLAEQCGVSVDEMFSAYSAYYCKAEINAQILGLSEEETAAYAAADELFRADRFRTAREVYQRRFG